MAEYGSLRLGLNKTNMKMKNREQSRRQARRISTFAGLLIAATLMLSSVLTRGFGVFAASCNSTTDCQQQINDLSVKNDAAKTSLSELEAKAGSYQATINALQAQINSLQGQINENVAMQAKLTAEIAEKQQELDRQKSGLAEVLKALYVSGQMSTVEMLATSKDLSAYVDAATYSSAVQNKIQETLATITKLQQELRIQKAQVEQLLTALHAQQAQVAASRDEQNRLLSMNESQQTSFNATIAANRAQIDELRRQQAAMIQVGTTGVRIPPMSGGSGGACDNGYGNGRYPMTWCNTAMDTLPTIPYSSDTINRECTSYAYWYFTQVEGHTDFRAYGNARDWAATSNYPVHDVPKVGAMAVETTGTFGHVAIVQALPGETYAGQTVPGGYVLVSEMNYDWGGHFRYSFSPLSKFSDYVY